MIDPQVIQRLATQYQTTTLNVAREYCQHLVLSAFYQHREADRVLFKGGTALRVIYGSPRFSEDLDFSGVRITKTTIEDLIAETLSAVERVGIAIELEEAKVTSGGYLGIIRSRFLDYDVKIQLEISLRSKTACKPEMTLITSDFVPAYTLLHMPQERLVHEKLEALFGRAKPRDFYDLYFILRKRLFPPKDRQRLKEVLVRLKHMRTESFRELRLFLPRDQHMIMKDFRTVLEREIQRYL